MKFQIIFLLSFFIFLLSSSYAQTQQQIMQSGTYYFGSGLSSDIHEARDRALEELTSQIAVRVASSFKRKIKEGDKDLNENVESILRTHSAATLKNVKFIKSAQSSGEIEVFCYLAKTEVAKIFEERKRLIFEMYEKAQQAEKEGNYAQALKLCYFGLLLSNSVPDESVRYNNVNFTLSLPEEINRIINSIHFQVVKDIKNSAKERQITLQVSHKGASVSLLDFSFWDGSNQISVQARDGSATFKLYGASASFKSLTLTIDYAYYQARDEYRVIDELWDIVEHTTFNTSKTLSLKETAQVAPQPASNAAINWNLKLSYNENIPVIRNIKKETVDLLNILKSGGAAEIRQKYGGDPFLRSKLSNYISYNRPQPASGIIKAQVNKTGNGYELRKVRMLHSYPSINKQTTEYLVLDFSDRGELLDINAAITENLYKRFVRESEFSNDWKKRRAIIKFIEKYRTAYLTRDIKTVDLMFAEQALILVGRKILRKELPDGKCQYKKFSKEPDYEYLKLSKEKYIKRQRDVFKIQKDIFLNFGSFDIFRKNNTKNVYGVEMRQSYFSTSYSDEGYLFLLIDFNERDPLIYVRAWQPNEWDKAALVRTANFRIN